MKKTITLLSCSVLFAGLMNTSLLYAQSAGKNVLIEEYTGAWCGYCPDGAWHVELIQEAHPKTTLAAAVHEGDGMQIPEGKEVCDLYVIGYPSATFDRHTFAGDQGIASPDRSNWESHFNDRNVTVPVVDLTVTKNFNSTNRQLDVTIKGKFVSSYISAGADLRLNCYIIEDEVSGKGANYDQVNYYSKDDGGSDASHPYYNQPYKIAGYKHMNVVRKMLGGAWGSSGILPFNVSAGYEFTYTYTYTIPASWNPEKLRVYGLVQDYNAGAPNTREILNVNVAKVITNTDTIKNGDTTGIFNDQEVFNFGVFNSPAHNKAQIMYQLINNMSVSLEVYDILGHQVKTLVNNNQIPGDYYYEVSRQNDLLVPGIYICKGTFNGKVYSGKICIQ